jgi:uncharacterized protein YcbK (DUF882 family)
VEDALWTALETLEQRAAIVARLASRARKNGQTTVAKRFDAQLRDISAKTQTLRTLLLTGGLRESQSNEVEEPTSDAEQSVARG